MRRQKSATRSRSRVIPLGANIHCIEIMPGRGGQIARSAGQQATLSNREGGYALVKLPSGEIRRIHDSAYATIGQVGNVDHMNVSSGKAGRTRWQGRRPHVRGYGHEPDRSPDGRRSGQIEGRRRSSPSSQSVGTAGEGFQDAREAQSERSFHPRAPAEKEIVYGQIFKKGPFVEPHLLEKIDKMNSSGVKKPVKTWSRRSMVTPDFVGHTFLVHNGKIFQSVFVTENMVGHKLGEFSPTRIFKKHGSHTAKVTK